MAVRNQLLVGTCGVHSQDATEDAAGPPAIRLPAPADMVGQLVELDIERTAIPRYVVVRCAGALRRIDLDPTDEGSGHEIVRLAYAARRGVPGRFVIAGRG